MIDLAQILFYLYSAILVGSATAVITARNQIHSALFLVLTFFTASVLWILLETEFLALTLIVVYVGAVMVLFLFVIMMLDSKDQSVKRELGRYLPMGLLVAAVMAFEGLSVVSADRFGVQNFAQPESRAADYSNIAEVGRAMFTEHIYAFEIAAMILLVALVAALVLTLRNRENAKRTYSERQVLARKEDRVKLVKMKSESRQ